MAGNGSRYFFLFLLGLVAGVIGTVMALRALDARKDHFPDGLMQVQAWHLGQLKTTLEQSRCGATDTLPHLQALRTTGNDLESAFPGLRDDTRFGQAASHFRASLDEALTSPPLNCAGVGTLTRKLGDACKACHQDFRG
jgi:hypothetical protein